VADLTASGAIAIAIQQVYDQPQLLVETDSLLDGLIAESGRATQVSIMNYRLGFQTAIPGGLSAVQLDNPAVNFPTPTSSEWQEGTLTPNAWAVPVGWTKLAELIGKPGLSVVDIVAKQLADTIERVKQVRDMMLCAGDGTGFLGNVTAVDTTNLVLTFNDNDFGSRLIVVGQPIDIYNGLTLRGTCTCLANTGTLGGAQTITVDSIPGSTAAGDVARVNGLTSGAPVFTYGIPYWLNNSFTGMTAGIDRSQPENSFIVSNGVNANNSSVSLALLRLPFDQVRAALGVNAVKNGKFKIQMHLGNRAAYEQLAAQQTQIISSSGKFDDFDLLFKGAGSIGGSVIIENIHAHMQRVDYLNLERWGKIKWGNPPFWFTSEGRKVFQQVGTNGQITSGAASFMIDTVQYFVDNPKAQSTLYNLRQPVGY
jgi:hypothetical protein